MPRPRKQSALEARIGTILTVAARQIADLVRADIAEQLSAAIGGGGVRRATASAAAPAPAGGGKRGRRGALNAATLSRVLDAGKSSAGLRSEQLQKQLPALPPKTVKAALAKLRESKRVKTSG